MNETNLRVLVVVDGQTVVDIAESVRDAKVSIETPVREVPSSGRYVEIEPTGLWNLHVEAYRKAR